ncbi:methionine adenosyltransferase [Streptomyces sp. NPDC001820]|uniref:methionine adenosyltransferase n=1 Tax=Streptomyces sp. NPDC001820 TaxID=3364613 RepID=UPI00369004EB
MSLRLFTSESVTEGNPDKVADQISDAILDALMEKDLSTQASIDTLITAGRVQVTGKATATRSLNVHAVVRGKILEIGYDDSAKSFDGASAEVSVSLESNVPGADGFTTAANHRRNAPGDRETHRRETHGAGLATGYACDETPQLMPLPIILAHRLAGRLTEVRRNGDLPCLLPDGKAQVTVGYDGSSPSRLDSIAICSHHAATSHRNTLHLREIRESVVEPVLREMASSGVEVNTEGFTLMVNPGDFINGGPVRFAGLTGRKSIVDTYGGMARDRGGVLSGRDPSGNRAAAYALRWVAKNIVAAGLARRCEVQAAYTDGEPVPASLYIETFGTAHITIERIERAVREVFDLHLSAIIHDLDLLRPVYARTATYGHFGRELPEFTWERTDRAAQLKSAALL